MSEIKIFGRVRKLLEGLDAVSVGKEDEQITLTQQSEQLMAMGAAPYQEITRVGRGFYLTTTTAVAAVVAVPSTAVLLALYNNEPDGGRSYIVDWVAALNAASTAVASQATILILPGQVRETPPTDSGLIPKKTNGNGNVTNAVVQRGDTRALSVVNTTVAANTGIAANWIPAGPSAVKPGAATTPGYACYAPVDGRFIVPPGRFFGITVLANVVGETFTTAIGWHEKQLTLG